MSNTIRFAILDQMIESVVRCLTPKVAQRIAALCASADVQNRIDELADKSSDGTISSEEQIEYERWVRAINFLGILQAKARKIAPSNSPS